MLRFRPLPNRRCWALLTALVCASLGALSAKSADTSEKPATTAAPDVTLHISPLATEGPKPEPITPPKPEELSTAIERGVKFLLDDQKTDGSWGGPENSKSMNIYAPPPGAHDAFRTAVTSLVIMALIDAQPRVAESERPTIDKAVDRGAAWLDANLARLKRATPDALYNIWGHAYSLQCLVALHERAHGNAGRQAKLKELAQHQADMLARYSFVGGGWSYYDLLAGTQTPSDSSFSFVTATGLIALKQGESIDVTFPDRLTKKAIASLLRQQKPDFSYAYGEYTMRDPRYDERPGGSLGRSQACNLALMLYGDKRVTDDVLKTWLNRLFARNGWLSMARKRPVPHDSYFQVAGYFYYYGHWYAAQCIDQLPQGDRPYFQDHLAHIILPLQEKDGSWWDFPLYNYHRQYGTAMAVMTLVRCQKPSG
ncbi:MAG TPA: prenyltransferase/squalene oxidase repeat-containing protein [Lacipirellulaceae bacterium]|nr:prenyltransferase/squalene oxidase repeat-containing protein [Lacipirellulaceae bacterium]